mgnify:CR=1 FL=1
MMISQHIALCVLMGTDVVGVATPGHMIRTTRTKPFLDTSTYLITDNSCWYG